MLRGDATRLPFPDGSFDAVDHVRGARAHPGRHRRRSPSCTGCSSRAASSQPRCRRGCPRRSTGCCPTSTTRRPRSAGTSGSTRRTELKAKLRAAGLDVTGSHHAHALHSPYWWLKCAVGRQRQRPPARRAATARSSSGTSSSGPARPASPSACCRRCMGKSLVLLRAEAAGRQRVTPPASRRSRACSRPTRSLASARPPARLQTTERDDPVVRRAATATRGTTSRRRWRSTSPVSTTRRSRPTAGWPTPSSRTAAGTTTTRQRRHRRGGASSTPTSCAYIATGVWHHWLLHAVERPTPSAVADGRAGARLGARAPPRRRPRAVGRRGRRHPHVGLRPAHRLVEHRPRADRAATSSAASSVTAARLGRARPT